MPCRSLLFALIFGGCSFQVSGFDFGSAGGDAAPDDDGGNPDALAAADLLLPPDLARPPDLAGSCANGKLATHVGDLAEGDLSSWGAEAPMPWFGIPIPPTVKVEADNQAPNAGLVSVRLTVSSDKAVLTYPKAKTAAWNLTPYTELTLSVAADNSAKQNDPGWQETDPHVIVATSDSDYFTYVPSLIKLPRNPGTWVLLSVPLAGGGGWARSQTGNPSLANINYIAFSMDTWGFGFKVWVDGVTFEPGPFVDCPP
jgi:hypothetical protein